MRAIDLVVESLNVLRSAKVPALLQVIVVAGVCLASLITVGGSAAAAADVAATLRVAGSQRLTVTDTQAEGFLKETTLVGVRSLDSVEAAVAVSRPFDVTNGATGPGGTPIAAWAALKGVGPAVDLVAGRLPAPGEAIVSVTVQQRLGLVAATGWLQAADGRQFPLVGSFRPRPGFDAFAHGALIGGDATSEARQLHVLLSDVSATEGTVGSIMAILAPLDGRAAQVESPAALASTAREMSEQLRSRGRSMLSSIMAAGGLLVLAVTVADTLLRRRDLGRRRTLGATRADIVVLVLSRTLLTAVLGAGAGTTVGLVFVHAPVAFAAGVAYLSVAVACAAALPPAIVASRQDPVRVLRSP